MKNHLGSPAGILYVTPDVGEIVLNKRIGVMFEVEKVVQPDERTMETGYLEYTIYPVVGSLIAIASGKVVRGSLNFLSIDCRFPTKQELEYYLNSYSV